MKRRDLLVGAIALLGSAAVSAGGAAYALNANGLAPKPPVVAEPSGHGAPAGDHGAKATPDSHAAPSSGHDSHAAPAAAHDAPHWSYEGALWTGALG